MSRQTDTRASVPNYPTRAFTRTQPQGFGRRALQHRSFVLGALLTTLLIAAALLSFVWTPGSAHEVDMDAALQASSSRHWLGTDAFGRDTASQILVGARASIAVGMIAVGIGLALGEIGEGLSPYPFVLSLPQDEHERFLISKLAAAGVHVEWNVALDLWTQDDSEVQAILLKDDERQYCTFDYICGCDGARSKVREIAEFDFSGGTYDHLYYVADAQVAGSNTDLHAHLGANAFALMLPVRTSGMQRLIGILPDRPEGAPAPVFDGWCCLKQPPRARTAGRSGPGGCRSSASASRAWA